MKRILFLTTVPPPLIEKYLAADDWTNEMLPTHLSARGATVIIKRWTDEDIIPTLLIHDVATFLWAEDNIQHAAEFKTFPQNAKSALQAAATSAASAPANGNANNDHPRPSPGSYLEAGIRGDTLQSALVVQEFEPTIATGGYSFMFIGENLLHVVLKEPARGEFRCQSSFGGRVRRVVVEDVETRTLEVVNAIFTELRRRFGDGARGRMGYCRLDGLVTGERGFVLMEIEAIEPYLFLEMEMGAVEGMVDVLLG
ncbi:hypothetical protein BJX61DRAFT_545581 [Aspergillus egyptiacus]|nr:hypothetical protein BJX61DRAFT_545581 [Aspergillus egyptiacus]